MDTPDDLPREGQLLEQAREQMAAMPQNEAARRAGMSGTRWRQIVERDAPTMQSKRGVERLAAMSRVVAVTPGQWAEIGRPDVAAILRAHPKPGRPRTLEEVVARTDDLEADNARLRASMEALTQSLRPLLGDEEVDRIIEQNSENRSDAAG